MPGIFRKSVAPWVAFTAAMAAALTLASCGSSDPTAAEAGQTLKADILLLLKKRSAQDVTITDPGGRNIPCGEGKAKQTFAATGRDSTAGRDAEGLNAMLMGTLNTIARYKVVSANAVGQPVRVVNDETKTTLTLASPGNGTYAVRGETECLPAS